MSITLFSNPNHVYHHGFVTSLENSSRIKDGKNIIEIDTSNIDIPKKWLILLENIHNTYTQINTVNCQHCTMTNDIDCVKCVLCNSKLKPAVKLISNIDGDTTYMCDTSIIALKSLLKSIIYMINWQLTTLKHAFLLSRPPGHHSDNQNSAGFCIINNVAFAAEYLNKKVAIIDWDVHHGNGTQKIFYSNDNILFIDIHRNNFYPYTGNENEIGENDGVGYTVNIPMKVGSNETDYIEKFDKIIIPKIRSFNPEWMIISCGFDAHKDDPIGGMLLTSNSYRKFHDIINTLNIPITYLLEGGYNPYVISESIEKMCY